MPAYNEGDLGSVPGSGRSPGEGNGNPLQYSCLENPMDRGAWWATVHRGTKSRTRLSDFTLVSTNFYVMMMCCLDHSQAIFCSALTCASLMHRCFMFRGLFLGPSRCPFMFRSLFLGPRRCPFMFRGLFLGPHRCPFRHQHCTVLVTVTLF